MLATPPINIKTNLLVRAFHIHKYFNITLFTLVMHMILMRQMKMHTSWNNSGPRNSYLLQEKQ